MLPLKMLAFSLALAAGILLTNTAVAADISGVADVTKYQTENVCSGEIPGAPPFAMWRDFFLAQYVSSYPAGVLTSKVLTTEQVLVFMKNFNNAPPAVTDSKADFIEIFKSTLSANYFVVLVLKGCVVGTGESTLKDLRTWLDDKSTPLKGKPYKFNPQNIEV